MAEKVQEGVGRFYHHYPRNVALVTAQSKGKENVMAVAWNCALSMAPPLYGVSISPKRFSYDLILESGQFGVNFLPFEKGELVAKAGGCSGREVDKFQKFHIEKRKPAKTSVPLLKDAYTAYECLLREHHTYGDHEWLVGEIVAVHLNTDFFTEKEILDLKRVNPIVYLGADFYATAAKESQRFLDRELLAKT